MFATGLKTRRRVTELMEEPGLDDRSHRRALAGLARVNRLSGSSRTVWPLIRDLAHQQRGQVLRILDVGCGGGDVALRLARHAAEAHIEVQIDGCDISHVAVQHARGLARIAGSRNVEFFQRDALAGPLPAGYDVVMCSLLLHHLEPADVTTLLRAMADAAQQLVLACDLRRTRLGYWLAWLGCRLATRSPIIRTDGPRSVRAAYTMQEAQQLAEQAQLSGAVVVPRWPQRYLIIWRRQ